MSGRIYWISDILNEGLVDNVLEGKEGGGEDDNDKGREGGLCNMAIAFPSVC